MWIWYHVNTTYKNKRKMDVTNRIKICESCEMFNLSFRICNACGCVMDVKVIQEYKLDKDGKAFIDNPNERYYICQLKKW